MPLVVLLLITGMLMTFVTWLERMREKWLRLLVFSVSDKGTLFPPSLI